MNPAEVRDAVCALRMALGAIGVVRIHAREAHGIRLAGEGRVRVRGDPAGSLVLLESGEWRAAGGLRARFSNAYRWRFDDVVRISHERRGAGESVDLVELVPVSATRWITSTPHECGGDRYTAAVHVAGGRILLQWRVHGTRKRTLIRSLYHPAGRS